MQHQRMLQSWGLLQWQRHCDNTGHLHPVATCTLVQ
jgi:hypothetical protein